VFSQPAMELVFIFIFGVDARALKLLVTGWFAVGHELVTVGQQLFLGLYISVYCSVLWCLVSRV
jgi:hypothetical protein